MANGKKARKEISNSLWELAVEGGCLLLLFLFSVILVDLGKSVAWIGKILHVLHWRILGSIRGLYLSTVMEIWSRFLIFLGRYIRIIIVCLKFLPLQELWRGARQARGDNRGRETGDNCRPDLFPASTMLVVGPTKDEYKHQKNLEDDFYVSLQCALSHKILEGHTCNPFQPNECAERLYLMAPSIVRCIQGFWYMDIWVWYWKHGKFSGAHRWGYSRTSHCWQIAIGSWRKS